MRILHARSIRSAEPWVHDERANGPWATVEVFLGVAKATRNPSRNRACLMNEALGAELTRAADHHVA